MCRQTQPHPHWTPQAPGRSRSKIQNARRPGALRPWLRLLSLNINVLGMLSKQAQAQGGRMGGRRLGTWHWHCGAAGAPALRLGCICHFAFKFPVLFSKIVAWYKSKEYSKVLSNTHAHLNIDEYQACPPPPFPISISEERRAGPATKLSQTRLLCGCAFSCSRQVPPGTNTDRAQAGSACVVLCLGLSVVCCSKQQSLKSQIAR